MSEFNCPEPGCDYHIGIVGDLVTDDDFEAQDYYDQEIEEHERMHAGQRRTPGERLQELREHKGLHQEHLATRLRTFGLDWSRATLSKVERGEREIRLTEVPAICMALDLKQIQDFWHPGYIPTRTVTAVEALVEIGRILRQLDSMAEEKPPAVTGAEGQRDSPRTTLRHELDRLRLESHVGEINAVGFKRLNHDSNGALLSSNDFIEGGNFVREGFVGKFGDSKVQLGIKPLGDVQEFSLSVGDAPGGAGVGTSESTERGQTQGDPEKKMPPAVAAAEGDETKHSNGK